MRTRQAPCLVMFAVAAGVVATGCDDVGVEDCVSHYKVLATAPTWKDLRSELLAYKGRREVASLRTLERGEDVGIGDQKAQRIVKLVDDRYRSVAQAEVWQTPSGEWRAGEWFECLDDISDP